MLYLCDFFLKENFLQIWTEMHNNICAWIWQFVYLFPCNEKEPLWFSISSLLTAGNFLVILVCNFLQDEDIYTFFEPELTPHAMGVQRTKTSSDAIKHSSNPKHQNNPDKKSTGGSKESSSWNVLDLKKENYFSCAVGRTNTNARYLLNSSDDVVTFLKEMAAASAPNSSS